MFCTERLAPQALSITQLNEPCRCKKRNKKKDNRCWCNCRKNINDWTAEHLPAALNMSPDSPTSMTDSATRSPRSWLHSEQVLVCVHICSVLSSCVCGLEFTECIFQQIQDSLCCSDLGSWAGSRLKAALSCHRRERRRQIRWADYENVLHPS